jgi:hypothetical protein
VADNTTADYVITFIENGRLPGCHTHERLSEARIDFSAAHIFDLAGHWLAVVTHLHHLGLPGLEKPVEVSNSDLSHLQILAMSYDDLVGTRTYLGHVKWGRGGDT